MAPHRFAAALGSAWFFVFAACVPGELFVAGEGDGGADARLDAPRLDRAAPVDASHGDDAATDGAPDAAPGDATSMADAGHDAGADVLPPIYCGTTTCPMTTDECCVSVGGGGTATYACAPTSLFACAGDGSVAQIVAVGCGQPADCPGEVCCALKDFDDLIDRVHCQKTCGNDAGTQVVICNPDLPITGCKHGETCDPTSEVPGFYTCHP
jgi:hypothetical protein